MAKSVNGSIHSEDDSGIDGDNINVVIRVRPLNGREVKNDDLSMLQFPGDGGIWVRNMKSIKRKQASLYRRLNL